MGSKPPLQGHHPATPGHRVQSTGALWEEALMEKLFWKASAEILEEPPSPAGRGMLQQGSRGGVPPELHSAAPAEASTPEGTARGK